MSDTIGCNGKCKETIGKGQSYFRIEQWGNGKEDEKFIGDYCYNDFNHLSLKNLTPPKGKSFTINHVIY